MADCQDCESGYHAVFNGRPNEAFTFVALSGFKKLNSARVLKIGLKRSGKFFRRNNTRNLPTGMSPRV